MLSGCHDGEQCKYSHTKVGQQSDQHGKHELKAKPKANPKAIAKAMLAFAFAVLASASSFAGVGGNKIPSMGSRHVCRPAFGLIGTPFEAGNSLSQHVISNASELATGAGPADGFHTMSMTSDQWGTVNHYMLPKCPIVRSVGLDAKMERLSSGYRG